MVLQTQFAQVKDNSLYIDDIDAMELVKKYGTPLYVMSEGHIRHQMNELKTSTGGGFITLVYLKV